jgi:hypothetical protein
MKSYLRNTIWTLTIISSLVLPLSILQASENIKIWSQRICNPEEVQSWMLIELQPWEKLEIKIFRESGKLYSEKNHSAIEWECWKINIIPAQIWIKAWTIWIKITDSDWNILDLNMLEFENKIFWRNEI